METLPRRDGHPRGPRMGAVRGPVDRRSTSCSGSSARCRFNREGARRLDAPTTVPVPERLAVDVAGGDRRRSSASARSSTRSRAPAGRFADAIVTTSPDVTVSTNLGAVGQPARPVRAREPWPTRSARSASPRRRNGSSGPKGQHIELGIAEMNLFILLVGARAVAFAVRRAAPAGRHALRSLHPARPRCAQLRLLPGCPLPAGGDAVGHHAGARRAARTSRSARR